MTTIGLIILCGTASATDGYFSHGYGMKAKGRGGTAYVLTDNAFGGADNPRTLALASALLGTWIYGWLRPRLPY